MKYNPESFIVGFFTGLFTILGIDPEMVLYKSLAEIIKEIGGRISFNSIHNNCCYFVTC